MLPYDVSYFTGFFIRVVEPVARCGQPLRDAAGVDHRHNTCPIPW
jgi:hypothetical protein